MFDEATMTLIKQYLHPHLNSVMAAGPLAYIGFLIVGIISNLIMLMYVVLYPVIKFAGWIKDE